MHIENIDYEYKNGILVQLDGEDVGNLLLMLKDLKKELPNKHIIATIRLIEWILYEVEN